jgi:tRNA-dihydrouridine synthase B
LFAIGPHKLSSPVVLAPMAGVTDLPFRKICRRMGAGLAISEMVISNPAMRASRKTQLRLDHTGETGPRAVQIVGSEPEMMAAAASFNVERGADIIDINMGCPMKKVCKKAAGSALLRDSDLVQRILEAVVAAVAVPVTLKIRTGWDRDSINALAIGNIAQDSGIQALTIHGRTRQCRFAGSAEYDTIAEVATSLHIPVIANGDICTPEQARDVLDYTGAAGVMIGRAAQGNPWIFSATNHLLEHGVAAPQTDATEIFKVMLEHLHALHQFYGLEQGMRIARKHIGWYLTSLKAESFNRRFNTVSTAVDQHQALLQFFETTQQEELAA